ncbi:uncharacterized protein DNG_08041 [Cephalotrichum gorgonifer]|uniref:Uncharacterized protein n=1 Tax=Cephalotrichum gorgonifer TaxID=2041049 RepID=A0AAE8SY09_9PEZI|nr:uncharacterized protein DNG_08041 [Cephalotrichum gorgonifer]
MASPAPQYSLGTGELSFAYRWIEPISIDDEDISFGGKALSAWYEEERTRARGDEEEEERRGRPRHRTCHSSSSSHQSSKATDSKK